MIAESNPDPSNCSLIVLPTSGMPAEATASSAVVRLDAGTDTFTRLGDDVGASWKDGLFWIKFQELTQFKVIIFTK